MADNYLETRYAQIFENGGNNVKHFVSKPSLDSLLRKSLSKKADTTYKVHPLQAEAIIRTVEEAFKKNTVGYTREEDKILLTVNCSDPFLKGKICQIMELKAAEMGLGLDYKKDKIELYKTI